MRTIISSIKTAPCQGLNRRRQPRRRRWQPVRIKGGFWGVDGGRGRLGLNVINSWKYNFVMTRDYKICIVKYMEFQMGRPNMLNETRQISFMISGNQSQIYLHVQVCQAAKETIKYLATNLKSINQYESHRVEKVIQCLSLSGQPVCRCVEVRGHSRHRGSASCRLHKTRTGDK